MKPVVARVLKVLAGTVVILGVGYGGVSTWAFRSLEERLNRTYSVKPDSLAEFMPLADPQLGKRIVEVRSGCIDCHGPDLGGRTFIDDPAMGKISSANITPAKLASWTDDEIGRAIRHGIGKDDKALFFMPAVEYIGMSGGDLASVVAYLRTVPAVERDATPIEVGPLGGILVAAGKIPLSFTAELIDHSRGFNAKPAEEATAEFGRYLAQSCTGCHGETFAGGPIPGAPPDWPAASDLTSAALGKWSEDDFIRTLKTGTNPSGAKLRPPFPLPLTSQMSDVELKALWAFFKTVQARLKG